MIAEAANDVALAVLSRGLVLTMALGRCALAEAERDVRYWDYWAQTVESAEAVLEAWTAFEEFCAENELIPCWAMKASPVHQVVEVTLRMARTTVGREEKLGRCVQSW